MMMSQIKTRCIQGILGKNKSSIKIYIQIYILNFVSIVTIRGYTLKLKRLKLLQNIIDYFKILFVTYSKLFLECSLHNWNGYLLEMKRYTVELNILSLKLFIKDTIEYHYKKIIIYKCIIPCTALASLVFRLNISLPLMQCIII